MDNKESKIIKDRIFNLVLKIENEKCKEECNQDQEYIIALQNLIKEHRNNLVQKYSDDLRKQ